MEKEAARDELIPMGKCSTCGKEWEMTVGEKQFFDSMIVKKAAEGGKFSMPNHCKDCRDAKKGRKVSPESIISKVEAMARKADEGLYNFDGEILAADLMNVSKMLKAIFPRKNRSSNEQNKESVGQPAASGSLQTES